MNGDDESLKPELQLLKSSKRSLDTNYVNLKGQYEIALNDEKELIRVKKALQKRNYIIATKKIWWKIQHKKRKKWENKNITTLTPAKWSRKEIERNENERKSDDTKINEIKL